MSHFLAPLLITKSEAMQLLSCSRGTIDRMERDGLLKPVRLRERGYRRYRLEDIHKLVGVDQRTRNSPRPRPNDTVIESWPKDTTPGPHNAQDTWTPGNAYLVDCGDHYEVRAPRTED